MANDQKLYDLYLQTFGKVKSGTKLTSSDYFHRSINGATAFSTDERLAVSMAVQDVANNQPMRAKSEFFEELKRLGS